MLSAGLDYPGIHRLCRFQRFALAYIQPRYAFRAIIPMAVYHTAHRTGLHQVIRIWSKHFENVRRPRINPCLHILHLQNHRHPIVESPRIYAIQYSRPSWIHKQDIETHWAILTLINGFAHDRSVPYCFCHSSKVIPGIFTTRPNLVYQLDIVKKYKNYTEIDTEPYSINSLNVQPGQ